MINSYLSTIMEFFCVYYIIRKIQHLPLKPQKKDFIALLFICLCVGSISSDYQLISWISVQISYFVYIIVVYKRKELFQGILLFSTTLIFIACFQYIAAAIISHLSLNQTSNHISYIGNLFTLSLAILLLRIPVISNIFYKVVQAALPYKLIMLNSYIVLFVLMLIFKLNSTHLYSNIYFVVFIVLFLVITNGCVLYYDQRMYIQQQEIYSYKKNLPIYQSLIDEIRANQHEYSNRLQSLQLLTTTCKSYDELIKALHEYTVDYTHPLYAYPLLQINMPLLAASLYNLSSKAEKNNIIVRYDVVNTHLESKISENHLADFACIILQNAIEACSPGDNIYVHLSSQNGNTRIEIRNPSSRFYTKDETLQFFLKNYSTKKKIPKENNIEHGLGLYYLQKELIKYNGSVCSECIDFDGKYWIIFCLEI